MTSLGKVLVAGDFVEESREMCSYPPSSASNTALTDLVGKRKPTGISDSGSGSGIDGCSSLDLGEDELEKMGI